ncbi:MAG TPA: carotenoid biosynthesis protein, partial [Myxococcaceae bacterium]|nr:carotenoid biosynthesis protein [Myxococcaceae bacterium]
VALHAMSAATVSGKALGLGAAAQALLPQLTEYVGEDLELGRRVAAGGGEVALARASARVPADEAQTWRSSVERLTRWMQVLRAHRPGLYPTVPLLFTPSLPLIALALLWGGAGLSGAVAALVGVRMALSLSLSGGRGYEWVWGEALLVTAFTRSLAARTLRWRGRSFALSSGGRMVPVFADAPPEGR